MGKIRIEELNIFLGKMGRLDKVKDFFRNIFGRNQKLLGSGENAEYLGENKYSIKTDNLSPEDTYELTERLVDKLDDSMGEFLAGTSKHHDYEHISYKIRSEEKLAKFLIGEGKIQKAIEKLDFFYVQCLIIMVK